MSRTKRSLIWASLASAVFLGCSSSNSSSEGSEPVRANKEAACERLAEYATSGVPATYVTDAVNLLEIAAEELAAAGLTDAADAVVGRAIPALEGDFVTALQFKPIVSEIHRTWCN